MPSTRRTSATATLAGRFARLPILDRRLRLVADEHVDPEFGTGLVKVTPFHDPNDYEIAQRHDLPGVRVIGLDGRMTAEAGPDFEGLDSLRSPAPRRGASPGGEPSDQDRAARPQCGPLAAKRRADRTDAVASVVRRRLRHGEGGARGRRRRTPGLDPGLLGQDVGALAHEHPALGHLASALVGGTAFLPGTTATAPATWR